MSEYQNQDIDLENNEEDIIESEETQDNNEVNDLMEQLETERAKIARLEQEKGKLNRLLNKPKPFVKEKEVDSDIHDVVKTLEKEREMRNYAEENSISFAQAQKIFSINSSPTKETLNDPFIKAGLDAMNRASRVENNTPGSKPSPSVGGKTFKEMTEEERSANFSQLLKK